MSVRGENNVHLNMVIFINRILTARSGSSTITKPISFVSSTNQSAESQSDTVKPNQYASPATAIPPPQKRQRPDNYRSFRDFTNHFANVYNNFIIYEPIDSVVVEQKSYQILLNSAAKQKIPFAVEYVVRKPKMDTLCTVHVQHIQVAGATDESKKVSRTKACDLALKTMKQCCFTIKVCS